MTDFLTKEKRSKVMSAIRSKGNETTELAMIRLFRENKITGWRRNIKLHGKPDFAFPKNRLVVFVDGCFWHGHLCLKPRDSLKKGFWKEKIERNQERDKLVNKALRKEGWKVIRNLEVKSLFFVQGFLTQRTRSTQRGEMPSFVTLVTFVLKPFWFWLVQVRIWECEIENKKYGRKIALIKRCLS